MTRQLVYLLGHLVLIGGCSNSNAGTGDAAMADLSAPDSAVVVDANAATDFAKQMDFATRVDLATNIDLITVSDLTHIDLAHPDLTIVDLAGPGDAGVAGCSPPCAAGNTCVRDQIYGGALLLPMNGVCPPGTHVENNLCVRNPTYQCMPSPQGCAGTVTCACASETCIMQQSCGYHCVAASATEIDCECDVP